MKRLLRSCVRYVKDARWIAECMLKDSVCGSFVSPGRIRQLLQYELCVYNLDDEVVRGEGGQAGSCRATVYGISKIPFRGKVRKNGHSASADKKD